MDKETDFKLTVIIDGLAELAEKLHDLANHLQYIRKLAQSAKGELEVIDDKRRV